MVPLILYFLVGTCAAFSWPAERLRVEKVGSLVRREVDGPAPVPPFNSVEGLTRTHELYTKVREEVESVLYDHPLRSPSIDNEGGCNYYNKDDDNSPNFESNQVISVLPS